MGGLRTIAPAQFSNARWIQQHQTWRADYEPMDMDGDGDLDVAIFDTMGELAWLENDGNDVFEERHSIDSFNNGFGQFEVGDVNGDGANDFVVYSASAHRLAWSKNLGGGEFSTYQTIYEPEYSSMTMELGDLDHDGDVELVAAFAGTPDHVHVFDLVPGTTEFTDLGAFYVGNFFIRDMKLLDVNLDGHLDLIIAHSDSLGVFQINGTGDNGFGSGSQMFSDSLNIKHMFVADMDGDSDQDLVVQYNGGVGLIENNGGVLLQPTLLYAVDHYYPPIVGDIDGDGDVDVIDDNYATVDWYHNNAGDFSERSVFTSNHFEHVSLYDLDFDGDLEVFGGTDAGSFIGFYENLGNDQFAGLAPVGRGVAGAHDMKMADLDGDGLKDLVVASAGDSRLLWYPSDRQKFLEPYVIIDIQATTVNSLAIKDDDADGDMDILAGLKNPALVVRYENLGGGVFADRVIIADSVYQVNELISADLDDDGIEELVIGGISGVFMMHLTGLGLYGETSVVDTLGLITHDMEIADLDMDGALDLVVASYGEHSVYWYANNGTGTFGPRQTITMTAGVVGAAQVADLDGDGDNDVLTTNNGPHMVWFANDGAGSFTLANIIDPVSDDVGSLRCLDMDMDGDVDILASFDNGGGMQGAIAWYPNDGAGGFTERRSLMDGLRWLGWPDLLDLDSDGDPDVIFSEFYKPSIRYFENLVLGGTRVRGHVYSDEDGDGVRDPDEPPVPMVFVVCDPDVSSPISGPDGLFYLYLPEGNYEISPANLPEFWGVVSDPATYHIQVLGNIPLIDSLDLGLAPVIDTTLVRPHIDVLAAPCGGETIHYLTLVNAGTTIASGVVSYSIDPAYEFLNSTPPPDSVVGNNFFWHFSDLPYMQPWAISCAVVNPTSNELADLVQENALTVTTAYPDGSPMWTYTATLPIALLCSYDPNDKAVLPKGHGEHGAIAHDIERLTYTIRFQNIGAGPAFDVRVRDRLSEHLDPATVRLDSWSHVPTDLRVEADGELAVEFAGIMLPGNDMDSLGSQGFITFNVAVRPDRPALTEVRNTAEIHFDFEEGIMTNTTLNTLVNCANWLPSITTLEDGTLEATSGTSYQWLLDGMLLPGDTLQQLYPLQAGTYTAQVIDHYGCSTTSDGVQVVITSVPLNNGSNFKLYPNITSGQFRVVLDRPLAHLGLIELVDMQGRTLRTWPSNASGTIVLDASGSAAGMYIVRVTDNGMVQGVAGLVIR